MGLAGGPGGASAGGPPGAPEHGQGLLRNLAERGLAADRALAAGSVALICSTSVGSGFGCGGCGSGRRPERCVRCLPTKSQNTRFRDRQVGSMQSLGVSAFICSWPAAPLGGDAFPAEVGHGGTFSAGGGRSSPLWGVTGVAGGTGAQAIAHGIQGFSCRPVVASLKTSSASSSSLLLPSLFPEP